MEINIILGMLLGIFAIYFGAPDIRTDVSVYMQLDAFILVAGGTIASSLISTSLHDFKQLFKAIGKLFFGKKNLRPDAAVEALVDVSKFAQKTNKQELSKKAENIGDGFMRRGLTLVGAGLDKSFIDQTLETDMLETKRRHLGYISMVRTMGSFAPMFGMAGTVIGVVQVLKNVTDIENIVSGMALALLTTLYGLFLSSLLFIPLSNKLRMKSEDELLTKEIIRVGILMILDKEIPLKVEQYLMAYLGHSQKRDDKKK